MVWCDAREASFECELKKTHQHFRKRQKQSTRASRWRRAKMFSLLRGFGFFVSHLASRAFCFYQIHLSHHGNLFYLLLCDFSIWRLQNEIKMLFEHLNEKNAPCQSCGLTGRDKKILIQRHDVAHRNHRLARYLHTFGGDNNFFEKHFRCLCIFRFLDSVCVWEFILVKAAT